MHPTLLPRPFHHDGWVYEEKIDGYRMVAIKAGGVMKADVGPQPALAIESWSNAIAALASSAG
jgi:hypothetical protein